jgi:hypothetical protein
MDERDSHSQIAPKYGEKKSFHQEYLRKRWVCCVLLHKKTFFVKKKTGFWAGPARRFCEDGWMLEGQCVMTWFGCEPDRE